MNNNYNFKAAFSQIDITPNFEVELIGCYRKDSKSKGVLHPLLAQMLLMEFQGAKYCLITIDSLGFTTELSSNLRQMVADELKTELSHIMLCFSHTHSAPAPLSPINGKRYYQFLCNQILNSLADTSRKLKRCKTGWALTDTKIGENRRDGCTIVDDRLGALKITDYETDLPIAVILRITAHANILMSSNNKVSSDYFGIAREKLCAHFHCPIMIMQGAAGNIKPIGVDKIQGGNIADVERITDIFLNSAKKLHFNSQEVTNLQMYEKDIVYYSDVPSKVEAEQIADKAKSLFGIDGSDWLIECDKLRKLGITEQKQEGKISFFYLNEGCICGVPDEIFCEISLEASKRVNSPYLFLNGYTNGCTGYLPHHIEWIKGGYETLYSYLQYYPFHGHVMPFREDTADKIAEIVCDDWDKCYSSLS